MSLEDYLRQVDQDWEHLGAMSRGHTCAALRDARLIYPVRLPSPGWFIDMDHGDTLSAIGREMDSDLSRLGYTEPLELSHVLGNDRCLTLAIAEHLKNLHLFDGTAPIGVRWTSKLGWGKNYAVWMRRTDNGEDPEADGLSAGKGEPIRDDDPDFKHILRSFGLTGH
ncbi:hypothetical protein [Salana multivorans]